MLGKTLKWPVITLLIAGAVHFILEAALPELQSVFVPPVVGPVLLAFGIVVGYRAAVNGGNLGNVLLAGAVLGVLPLILDVGGFGIILGRGVHQGLLGGIAGFSLILWGSLAGGAFSLSK